MLEELHPGMKASLVFVGGAVLFLGLTGGLADFKGRGVTDGGEEAEVRRPLLVQHLFDGVRVRSGAGDSPVISCGSARIVKRKAGPLTFAAYDILLVDRLVVTFSGAVDTTRSTAVSDADFLSGHLLFPETENGRDRPRLLADRKFSGVEICQLELLVRDANGGSACSVLRAERAEGVRNRSLLLTDCVYMDLEGLVHRAPQAVLTFGETACLDAAGRHFILQDLIHACGVRMQIGLLSM